jgi:hypothetical protein
MVNKIIFRKTHDAGYNIVTYMLKARIAEREEMTIARE